MEPKDTINKLESSKEFKSWITKNKNSYLVHIFRMFDVDEFQIGYYNKDDTITTFIVNDKVETIPKTKIFKPGKEKVPKLEIGKVKIDFEKAFGLANEIQKKDFAVHVPIKKIAILQKLKLGQVYNITFLTQTFKMLNLKINSSDGKVVKKELVPIIEFKSPHEK